MRKSVDTVAPRLVTRIRVSKKSSFYRDLWSSGVSWRTLEHVTAADLIRVPLPARRYAHPESLTKIVKTYEKPFLSQWSLDDIAQEPCPIRSGRPLVVFSDPHRSMEWGLWMYAHGIVPILGESRQSAVTVMAARDYAVDHIVTDVRYLQTFGSVLKNAVDTHAIDAVIHSDIRVRNIRSLGRMFRAVAVYVSLSETGVLASMCPERTHDGVFHPVAGVVLQIERGRLIATKLRLLVTPIIRYRTRIRVKKVLNTCSCAADLSFSMEA